MKGVPQGSIEGICTRSCDTDTKRFHGRIGLIRRPRGNGICWIREFGEIRVQAEDTCCQRTLVICLVVCVGDNGQIPSALRNPDGKFLRSPTTVELDSEPIKSGVLVYKGPDLKVCKKVARYAERTCFDIGGNVEKLENLPVLIVAKT